MVVQNFTDIWVICQYVIVSNGFGSGYMLAINMACMWNAPTMFSMLCRSVTGQCANLPSPSLLLINLICVLDSPKSITDYAAPHKYLQIWDHC